MSAYMFVTISLLVIIYCYISVYFVCRRYLIQIGSEQVSKEAATKFLEERQIWKTTIIMIGGVIVFYLPGFLRPLGL